MDKYFTDEELVAVIQTGGSPGKELLSGTVISVEEAWAILIDRYDHQDPENPDICKSDLEKRAIGYWHGNRPNAQDTVARTWEKAVNNIDTVKGNFRGWIFTVLKNQFLDEWRKSKRLNSKLPILSLDATGPDEQDDENGGGIEWWANHIRAEEAFEPDLDYLGGIVPSAEQTHIDETEGSEANYQDLIHKFLSKGEAGFFVDYQAGLVPKFGKDKVKYFRLKTKLVKNMIRQWVASGRKLEDVMSPRQVNVLSAKYSLGRTEADIFKTQGITNKEELYQLLATAVALLLQAYLYNEGLDI